MKKAKENLMGGHCCMIEENLRKNNGKRAYQLMKDLTTVKQGKATAVQDRSGKCLTEERYILNRWKEYCSELYNHKASGDPLVLNFSQTNTELDWSEILLLKASTTENAELTQTLSEFSEAFKDTRGTVKGTKATIYVDPLAKPRLCPMLFARRSANT